MAHQWYIQSHSRTSVFPYHTIPCCNTTSAMTLEILDTSIKFQTTLTQWQQPLFGPIQKFDPQTSYTMTSKCSKRFTTSVMPWSRRMATVALPGSLLKMPLQTGWWLICIQDVQKPLASLLCCFPALLHVMLQWAPTSCNNPVFLWWPGCDNQLNETQADTIPNQMTPPIMIGIFTGHSLHSFHNVPLQFQFLHVKGHQEATTMQRPIQAELHNIEFIWLVKKYVQSHPPQSTSLGNPAIKAQLPPNIARKVIISATPPYGMQQPWQHITIIFVQNLTGPKLMQLDLLKHAIHSFQPNNQWCLVCCSSK